MPVASFLFLLFVSSVIFVYYVVPVKYRWLVILAANIFFYCSYGVKYLVYLIISSLITFLAALFLRKASEEYTNDVATADKGQKKRLEAVYKNFGRAAYALRDFHMKAGDYDKPEAGDVIADEVASMFEDCENEGAAKTYPANVLKRTLK